MSIPQQSQSQEQPTPDEAAELREHLQAMIRNHKRRLQKLQQQEARYGNDVPPHIETEIEDKEAAIAELEAQLQTLNNPSLDNPADKASQVPSTNDRVQLILQGTPAEMDSERRQALIITLAALTGISPKAIEVLSVTAGSIIFELGVPSSAVKRLRERLDNNSAQLRLLGIEKVVLGQETGQPEEWILQDRKFRRVGASPHAATAAVPPDMRRILIEAPSGEQFEADIPCGTALNLVAADFFESQGWPTQDRRGRGQRAVVELVNPNNPDETKRLNSEDDICESLENGDTIRIFPESIAGAVDQRARQTALIADHNAIIALAEEDPHITFEANRTHAPDRYEITLAYPSFIELPPGTVEPRVGETHRVEIILTTEYPRRAPLVRWLTPIFHPNIRQSDGAVCMGVLTERYLPGLGLARLVRMLVEMVRWRNFDAYNPFNKQAAAWAANPEHWQFIIELGGHPFQGPVEQLLKEFVQSQRTRITFRPLHPSG